MPCNSIHFYANRQKSVFFCINPQSDNQCIIGRWTTAFHLISWSSSAIRLSRPPSFCSLPSPFTTLHSSSVNPLWFPSRVPLIPSSLESANEGELMQRQPFSLVHKSLVAHCGFIFFILKCILLGGSAPPPPQFPFSRAKQHLWIPLTTSPLFLLSLNIPGPLPSAPRCSAFHV